MNFHDEIAFLVTNNDTIATGTFVYVVQLAIQNSGVSKHHQNVRTQGSPESFHKRSAPASRDMFIKRDFGPSSHLIKM